MRHHYASKSCPLSTRRFNVSSASTQVSSLLYSRLADIKYLWLTACVMNFIAFDAAYSVFPRATFEERRSLSFSALTDSDIRALGKYTMRGWSIISNLWPHQYHTLGASFYVNKIRWVNDSFSWVVPLDTTGMEPRPRLSASSEALVGDPVVHNSWTLARDTTSSKVYITYNIFRPTLFRYTYLVSDLELISNTMSEWLFQQGSLEHKKRRTIPEEFQASSWTWSKFSRLLISVTD